jgi:GT2 family glycosyltransferase
LALTRAKSRMDGFSLRVFIVGMHRAGASAAAQTIERLGVPFTRRSDLMPPSSENPKGHWESTVLSLFNEDLLRMLGGSWSAPPPLVRGWERDPSLDPLRELGKALVETVHPTHRWAWKDPRNSILLPFWLDALDVRPRIVLVHRNPLEIWKSLDARAGFAKPLALALWERYVRAALECARDLPTLVVPYEGLLEDLPFWSNALRSFLGCNGTTDAGIAIDPPLDKSLRHSLFSAKEVAGDPVLSAEQRLLFLVVQDLLGEHAALQVPELPAEAPSTQHLFAARLGLERARDGRRKGPSARGSTLEGIEEYVELDDLAHRASYLVYLERRRAQEEKNRARLRAQVGRFATSARISVLVAFHRPNAARLDRALRSVRSQIQPRWQLCLCDDGGTDDETTRLLADAAREDSRILLIRHERQRGIAAALNTALAAAEGDFVAFLDADDALPPESLAEVTLALAEHPRVDLLYTDEDRLDEAGARFEPFFKPGWSPDHLMSCAYLGRLLVVRRSLFERIGGLRCEYDGAEEYDLMLRASEAASEIVHLSKVLYHRGASGRPLTPRDPEAARRALRSALARRNEAAEVEDAEVRGAFRVRRAIHSRPTVSIIIPFRDEARLLERCLRSIREFAGYQPWQAVLMDNGSWEPETKAVLGRVATDPRCHVLSYAGIFNWSAINNEAVKRSCGDLLLFLNNDIESCRHGWLAAMVEHALRAEVGAVGGRLLYPNGMVQHVGAMLHPEAVVRHPFRFLPAEAPGYFGMAKIIRNCTAVTGACMMVRRRLFEELGGFDESLPVAFNDIDFCLRLLERGYRIVYTPYAELTHHESLTRGMGHESLHEQTMARRWSHRIRSEAYVSPHLPWRAAHGRLSEGAK